MKSPELSSSLDTAHRQLTRAGAIELELEALDQLLSADGRSESGVDTLVGVLASARRLPDTLVVHVLLAKDDDREPGVEAAFRDHCRRQAELAWREAMTVKRNGLRSLPRAVLIASAFGLVAAGAGALAESLAAGAAAVPLYLVAGIGMIAAWASAWLPIEQLHFDWRAPAHLAAAYQLLTDARLQIVQHRSRAGPAPRALTRTVSTRPAARAQRDRSRERL
jgi:hypothetical protein